MKEYKIITSVKELEKYIGKIIVTVKSQSERETEHNTTIRLLTKIEKTNYGRNGTLLGNRIYGKFATYLNKDGKIIPVMFNNGDESNSSFICYVRIPTEKEIKTFIKNWKIYLYQKYNTVF